MNTIQVVEKDGFYSCDIGITKEEWLSILQDKGTLLSFKDALLRFFYMPEHKGTCTAVSNVMGKKPGTLNILISKFGSYVQKKLGNRFEVLGTDGKPTRWIIPMGKGMGLPNGGEGTFEWELRPELVEAIKEYLYWYLIDQYKLLRKTQPINVKGNGDELYKWQLITASIGKTPFEILNNHVAHSNTSSKGGFANLISFQNNKALKYLAEGNRGTTGDILARLTDETVSLNTRLADYKSALTKIIPNDGYPNKAYDERTAATILTCFNPDKYTFYKREGVYDYLCKYLGVNTKKSGESYDHYLSLLEPLANLADDDEEFQSIVKPMLEGVRHSKLLLAQDIIWKLIGSANAKGLGYIYDLLFNTGKNMDNSKIDEYIELLKSNHNLILTGAPGTGKTHLAKQMAVEMLKVKDIEDLKGNEQFGFVQFHPSYDYTDFVEGLRPDGNGGFELRYGVFKQFCANAVGKYETKNFDAAFDELLVSIGDTMLKLKTPQGAEFGISVNSRGNLKLHTGSDFKEQGVLTRENVKSLFAGMPIYQYYKEYFEGVLNYLKKEFNLSQTENDPNKKYIFVIDEINRGEISKILGELFFSIDPGYRGTNGIVNTQYQNMVNEGDVFKNGFYVPENVYIIGTMNDIDRSVESMDFAMRRRFAWKEVTAKDSQVMLDNIDELIGAPIDKMKARMDNLNAAIIGKYKYKDGKEKIIPGLSQSFQIGAAYFAKYAKYMDNNPFEDLWEYHLKGLLAEYLRGNVDAEKELEMLKEAYDDSNNGQQSGETKPEGTGEDSTASA